jgi:transmembrane sensor
VEHIDEKVWALLQDDRFIQWVQSPTEDATAAWEKWMDEDPARIALVRKAREIARDLTTMEDPADAQQLSAEIWTDVISKLDTTPMYRSAPLPHKKIWPWLAAASLVGLLITGAAVLKYYHPHNHSNIQVATRVVDQDLQRTNHTTSEQEVLLVDGSKVILQPGASIRHTAFFQKDKREIHLEGNAFFEIAKESNRPFYVYTKDLVVHVLGTSFNVTTNKTNGDVTVLVQSGKVAVSKLTNPTKQQLILVSNQQVLYKEQTHDLVQNTFDETVVPYKPTIIAPVSLNFDEAPVVEILQTLENAYGIPFHYDKKTFASCMLTTTLGDETFEEKLKIVCEAIGATYVIRGNEVYIEGKPCKE